MEQAINPRDKGFISKGMHEVEMTLEECRATKRKIKARLFYKAKESKNERLEAN